MLTAAIIERPATRSSQTPRTVAPVEALEIGDYRLIARLARGGMAEVFLAVRRGLVGFTKLFVVKRMRDDVASGGLLLDEARLAARLHHPNIVQTFEGGTHDGAPFLAMEYLDGQSFDRVLHALAQQGRAFAPELATLVLCDVLAALEYAHDLRDFDGTPLGIVHRDVSPHNIFVTFQGEVKLVDFGVAKHALSTDETQLGMVKGKLTYMAPEQAERLPLDARADVFSVGVVMWESLALRRLFAADSPALTLRRLLYETVPSLVNVVPGIDPRLTAICDRALERDRDSRYRSASEMRAELEPLIGSESAARAALASTMQRLFAEDRSARAELIKEALSGDTLVNLSDGELAPSSRSSAPPPRRSSVPPHTPATASVTPARAAGRSVLTAGFTALLGALAAMLVLFWVRWPGGSSQLMAASASPLSVTSSTGPGAAASDGSVEASETVLRLCGSNTVGAELAPALIEAFLETKGASPVTRRPGPDSEHTTLTGTISGGKRVRVEISAQGSATGFAGLAQGTCDVGMASRAISEAEAARLEARGDGDLRSAGSEHVIALDGIAVIVHPNNPLRALDRAALHDIFTGRISDWAAVGGSERAITVLARDSASGTYDTFQQLVLGRDALTTSARRFAQSDALADAVASDPSAIGFVGLAYVRGAKALAVGEPGAAPMLPTQFTVATEGYMLSRRLYLYTLPQPRSRWVPELTSFVLSRRAQEITAKSQFLDLGLVTRGAECDASCSSRYAAMVAGAQRVSVDFRFRSASDEPDSRADRDLDRLVSFLREHRATKLLLLGFADALGDAASNQKLSLARAKTVERLLETRGVHAAAVAGFGSERPVASNDSDVGRVHNRRVEAWIAPL